MALGLTIGCILFVMTPRTSFAASQLSVPSIKMKMGAFNLQVTAGELLSDQPLGALVTLQPSILWSVHGFRSRIGLHFITDLGSDYGLMPISGIGASFYFYVLGLSSDYEDADESLLLQKSKPVPYLYASVTPANLNISMPSDPSSAFGALIYDLALGAGYDYPMRTNLVISGEITYRLATSDSGSASISGISYKGLGIFISFLATYY